VHTSCACSAVGQVLYSQTFTRSTGCDTLRQTTGLQCIDFRHVPCLVAESVTAKFFEGHHDRFGLVSINQCVCWRHSAPPPTEEDTATPPHASRGHHLPRCRRHRGGQVQAQAAGVAAFQRLGHGGTIFLPCAAHTASLTVVERTSTPESVVWHGYPMILDDGRGRREGCNNTSVSQGCKRTRLFLHRGQPSTVHCNKTKKHTKGARRAARTPQERSVNHHHHGLLNFFRMCGVRSDQEVTMLALPFAVAREVELLVALKDNLH